VFDLLSVDGKDLRQLPLAKRKARLAKVLHSHPRLLYVDHVEANGLAMFAGAMALGLEGVVAKDAKSSYVEGPRVT
jgi:ATP-dependent DNA ligase